MGSQTDHYSSPFSLTEEFVSVYRMHPLDPGRLELFFVESGEYSPNRSFTELQGRYTRDFMDNMGGHVAPVRRLGPARCVAQLTNALRQPTRIDGQITDWRNPEHQKRTANVASRGTTISGRALRMPRRKTIEEITPNAEWARRSTRLQRRRRCRRPADRHAGRAARQGQRLFPIPRHASSC